MSCPWYPYQVMPERSFYKNTGVAPIDSIQHPCGHATNEGCLHWGLKFTEPLPIFQISNYSRTSRAMDLLNFVT